MPPGDFARPRELVASSIAMMFLSKAIFIHMSITRLRERFTIESMALLRHFLSLMALPAFALRDALYFMLMGAFLSLIDTS